jgi:hypothetical protein
VQALDPLAVAIAEPVLEEPAQRGVDIAVMDQVVADLGEDGVGVEVEALLGPVPC